MSKVMVKRSRVKNNKNVTLRLLLRGNSDESIHNLKSGETNFLSRNNLFW